jgi:hypothetical protein
MKTPERRPGWMASSRQRAAQQPPPDRSRHIHGTPKAPSEARLRARGSNRGYNPYDTLTTRPPDVWQSKPKRS